MCGFLDFLREFLKDDSGSGAGDLVVPLIKIAFVIAVGVPIIGALSGSIGTLFTNMMNYLKVISNSGY